MAWTLPGNRIWELVTPATVAASPVVTAFFDTTGFTTLLLSYVFTNSTGTTTLTVEGSFDSVSQETDIVYGAVPASGGTMTVLHPYVRFRVVQATADATRTKIFVQARQ